MKNYMTTRRDFLRQSSMLMGSSLLMPSAVPSMLSALKKKHHIGLQLYSVRDEMKAKPKETLEKLPKKKQEPIKN